MLPPTFTSVTYSPNNNSSAVLSSSSKARSLLLSSSLQSPNSFLVLILLLLPLCCHLYTYDYNAQHYITYTSNPSIATNLYLCWIYSPIAISPPLLVTSQSNSLLVLILLLQLCCPLHITITASII